MNIKKATISLVAAIVLQLVLIASPVHAAPYGRCGYSQTGTYSNGSCSTSTNNGLAGFLPNTGQEYAASGGLVVFALSVSTLVYMLQKRRQQTKKAIK